MEIPWPKWMEFVVVGLAVVVCAVILPIIDRLQNPPKD
jgi:hypothetical protein